MSEIEKLIEKEAARLGNTICPELECCVKIAKQSKSAMWRVVVAERERCAKLAESFKAYGSYTEKNSKMPSRAIAAAIRKGTPE